MAEKSKSNLFLLELILSFVSFAVCASVCLTIFIKASAMSKDSDNLDNATLYARNLAECYRGCDGDADKIAQLMNGTVTDGTVILYFTFDWEQQPTEQSEGYKLTLCETERNDLFAIADITAFGADGEDILKFSATAVFNR